MIDPNIGSEDIAQETAILNRLHAAKHIIRHPNWCRHLPEDAPYTTDGTYDRLGPREVGQEHELRDYRLDAGETFAYSVTLTPVQSYGLGVRDDDPVEHCDPVQVRLSLRNLEDPEIPDAYLSPGDIDRLIAMLQRARDEAVRLVGAEGGRR